MFVKISYSAYEDAMRRDVVYIGRKCGKHKESADRTLCFVVSQLIVEVSSILTVE